ncbi:MAG: FkbM family methyltransferase [Rhodospirillales bacterium]|nr:FkbM family methyltransferase [Rhodospirillales bacterium]
MILHFGVWEPDVSRAIEQNLAPGDVFVDIGANIGYDTLLASPRTFALLQRNLEANASSSSVRPANAAVSDRPGTLDLYEVNPGNIGAATTLASRGGTLMASVEALPLEQILTPDELSRLRLIKMDVEGADPAPPSGTTLDLSGDDGHRGRGYSR